MISAQQHVEHPLVKVAAKVQLFFEKRLSHFSKSNIFHIKTVVEFQAIKRAKTISNII